MFNILVSLLGVLLFVLITIVVLSLGAGKSVGIIAAPGPRDDHPREPVYLEWTGRELVLHPEKAAIDLDRDISKITTWRDTYAYLDKALAGSPLEPVLAELAREDSTRYLVVLVRPSGFASFTDLRAYIESKGLDLGYEPIDQAWSIKLRRKR
jgi:hypothetical protein